MSAGLELGAATWPEAAAALSCARAALLPIGSTEAHGPHLPLATDVLIATETARRAALLLGRRGAPCVVLPALPYALTEFLAPFPGTISVRAETVARLLEDVADSVFRQGPRVLALVNAHLEPGHGRMLKEVAARIGAAGAGACVFPDQRRPPVLERLGQEFAQGGGHAGGYETSLVLAAAPEHVRDDLRARLAPNFVDLAARMREGKADAKAAGGPEAYFGDPAGASAAEGDRLYGVLAECVAEHVLAALSSSSTDGHGGGGRAAP